MVRPALSIWRKMLSPCQVMVIMFYFQDMVLLSKESTYAGITQVYKYPGENFPPEITLTGPNPIFIEVGSDSGDYINPADDDNANPYYNDPGATAEDLPDGTITGSIQTSGDVDLNRVGTYTINYTVTDDDANTVAATRTVYVIYPLTVPICFPKGTPVTTDQDQVAIEKLNPDKHTIRGKEIVAITQTRPLQKHIVCFEKDSLSKNVPSQQTFCSMEHKVFYKGEMTKARKLVDLCENVTFVSYNGETLYNVLLKKHDKMMINNLICETLHPASIAAKISTMKDGQKKNKIVHELSKIIKENNVKEYKKIYDSL